MVPEFKFCVLNCDKQCYLPSAPRPLYSSVEEHHILLIKNNSDSSEPRQRHCAGSSYSRIDGLNLEIFLTVVRRVSKVTVISPVNKEGKTTNVCYMISNFRKISCYITSSSSTYLKTLLTSHPVVCNLRRPMK
jgi:hypothetical protein